LISIGCAVGFRKKLQQFTQMQMVIFWSTLIIVWKKLKKSLD